MYIVGIQKRKTLDHNIAKGKDDETLQLQRLRCEHPGAVTGGGGGAWASGKRTRRYCEIINTSAMDYWRDLYQKI